MGQLRRLDSRLFGPVIGSDGGILTTRPMTAFEGQCFGDSGGPAFVLGASGGFSQVGVLSQVSAANNWCGGGIERYVDVAAHAEWLEDAIATIGRGKAPSGLIV